MAASVRRATPPLGVTLLYAPEDWYRSAEETVSLERTELHRTIRADVRIPNSGLGARYIDEAAETSNTKLDRFLFPITKPKKDQLLDIDEVAVSGSRVRFASHEEHQRLSKELVRQRVLALYLPMVLALPDDQRRVGLYKLESLSRHLCGVVDMQPEEARALVADAFPRSGDDLRWIDADRRPPGEHRLRELLLVLSDRYLKLAVIPKVRLGEELTLTWSRHDPFFASNRDENEGWSPRRKPWRVAERRLRDWMGTTPSMVTIKSLLAGRTSHYTFSFVAPEGYFLHNPRVFDADRVRVKLMPSKGAVAAAVNRGGGTKAKVFIRDAHKASSQLAVQVSCFEMPPGSTGFALGSGVMLLLSMVLTALAIDTFRVSDAFDTAAFIIALVAGSGVIVAPLLPRQGLYGAPTLTRVVLIANSMAGLTFALSLLMVDGVSRHGAALSALAPVLSSRWPGFGMICIVAVGCAVLFRRLLRITRIFKSLALPTN